MTSCQSACHKRIDEDLEIIFIENYLETPVKNFSLGEEFIDVETEKAVDTIDLLGYDVKVLYRKKV